jgi:hypothetical protein
MAPQVVEKTDSRLENGASPSLAQESAEEPETKTKGTTNSPKRTSNAFAGVAAEAAQKRKKAGNCQPCHARARGHPG